MFSSSRARVNCFERNGGSFQWRTASAAARPIWPPPTTTTTTAGNDPRRALASPAAEPPNWTERRPTIGGQAGPSRAWPSDGQTAFEWAGGWWRPLDDFLIVCVCCRSTVGATRRRRAQPVLAAPSQSAKAGPTGRVFDESSTAPMATGSNGGGSGDDQMRDSGGWARRRWPGESRPGPVSANRRAQAGHSTGGCFVCRRAASSSGSATTRQYDMNGGLGNR
jgi:hypothetical protein